MQEIGGKYIGKGTGVIKKGRKGMRDKGMKKIIFPETKVVHSLQCHDQIIKYP
jgi:hypothetical protein